MELQGILDSSRKVEYMLQQDKQVDGDSAESGDDPQPGAESLLHSSRHRQ